MITLVQYFGKFFNHTDATSTRKVSAQALLDACNRLEALALEDGVEFPNSPKTGTGVSGEHDGYGGFRPQDCPQGAAHSSHKEGMAVDRYDPHGKIDAWCMANFEKLSRVGIYIEHPSATEGWSHWTIRAPKSGSRAFFP